MRPQGPQGLGEMSCVALLLRVISTPLKTIHLMEISLPALVAQAQLWDYVCVRDYDGNSRTENRLVRAVHSQKMQTHGL